MSSGMTSAIKAVAAISAALQVGPEWLVYEQDTSYERDPVESATESLNYLRQLVGPGD